jgi:hypothetical protein
MSKRRRQNSPRDRTKESPEMHVAERSPGLGPLRLAQLVADLQLTPEQRVRTAEQTARASRWWNEPRPHYTISFSNFEDYFAWKRLDDLGV